MNESYVNFHFHSIPFRTNWIMQLPCQRAHSHVYDCERMHILGMLLAPDHGRAMPNGSMSGRPADGARTTLGDEACGRESVSEPLDIQV